MFMEKKTLKAWITPLKSNYFHGFWLKVMASIYKGLASKGS